MLVEATEQSRCANERSRCATMQAAASPAPSLHFSKTSRRTLEGRPTMSGGFLASQVKVPLSLNSKFLIRMEPSRRLGFPTNSTRSLKGPLLST